MNIEHIAIWTHQLEKQKEFYQTYFLGQAGSKYINPRTQFESYFLTFKSGARLEIMQSPEILGSQGIAPAVGYAHIAFSVGSKEQVDQLTRQLQADGYEVIGHPRMTGDGYYESVILDLDGNRLEITI